MFHKLLLYSLPVYLYGLELLLKALAALPGDSLAGPTLAGAGIGFLLPLTQLKPIAIDPALATHLANISAAVYSPRDRKFSDFVWLMFFVSLLAWMYTIFLTSRPGSADSTVGPLAIGSSVYALAIVLAEAKERI